MSLFHVLLAVALTLGRVRARWKEAVVERGCVGVLVVDVAVALLLGRPAKIVVLALVVGAFPWPLMGLEVLGQVARPLELLVAQRAFMNLRFGVLLPTSHRPEDLIVVKVDGISHRTLHRGGGEVLRREDLTCRQTYRLPVLMTNDLSWLPIVTHPSNK